LTLIAGLGLFVAGCGGDEFEKRFPVSGKVSYNGEPVAKGVINFVVPEGTQGRAASGKIQDGSYTMTTMTPDDGVVPGKYGVTILAQEYDLVINKARSFGGPPSGKEVAAANKRGKRLVPGKYSSAQTSGLKVEVKPESNHFDFDLTD
jgi:hypothetical protein